MKGILFILLLFTLPIINSYNVNYELSYDRQCLFIDDNQIPTGEMPQKGSFNLNNMKRIDIFLQNNHQPTGEFRGLLDFNYFTIKTGKKYKSLWTIGNSIPGCTLNDFDFEDDFIRQINYYSGEICTALYT